MVFFYKPELKNGSKQGTESFQKFESGIVFTIRKLKKNVRAYRDENQGILSRNYSLMGKFHMTYIMDYGVMVMLHFLIIFIFIHIIPFSSLFLYIFLDII